MSEESPKIQRVRKKSVKVYASKVLKESSVSAVSAIVSTGSIRRKIFLAVVFLLFTAGFLYQCIKFLAYVLTYPTIVSIEITKPNSYLAPAYTFCNHNKIKRSKFCKLYPDRCISPDNDFCDRYPIYCETNGTQVPKQEYYLKNYEMSKDEVLEMSHDLKDLLKTSLGEQPEGPLIRLRKNDGYDGLAACYSIRGRVDNSLDPAMRPKISWWGDSLAERFEFDPEEDEVFNPNSEGGVFLAIHSQFEAVNPFQKGVFLKPGYYYTVIVSMYEERLLEYPYKTDCLNYTKKWLNNNKRGPRSQEMCKQLCVMNAIIRCENCTYKELNYPSEHVFCRDEKEGPCTYDDFKVIETEYVFCNKECKDECLKLKYDYQVRERKVLPTMINDTVTKESRFIKVFIDIDDHEIYSFEYKPQYQEVEAFSYIGGFIGIWLGVSLVQVVDFIESAFRIARYFFRKGSTKCPRRCCSA